VGAQNYQNYQSTKASPCGLAFEVVGRPKSNSARQGAGGLMESAELGLSPINRPTLRSLASVARSRRKLVMIA
jgi:hypothetical protein